MLLVWIFKLMQKIILNTTLIPASRPRVVRRGGKSISFYPKKYSDFKNTMKILISKLEHTDVIPKDIPIEATLEINIPIPKSYSKKKKEKLVGSYHCKKPDIDNLVKSAFDSFNEVLYNDDSQIAFLKVIKKWSLVGSFSIEVKPI
jgi:Holliday junction resolvase RusA-like endonuclease